ncbi:hypothetical protein BKA61DRAFT_565392 [Leptodontidium sp. MPI-SDFR-AT-0119]|nr:hypothetical protein BKA61DRAFT_565392 [Leptodontidium sp. MPI-SDFR-AT-0119]
MRLQSVSRVAAILLGAGGLVVASENAAFPTHTTLDYDLSGVRLPSVSIQVAAARTHSAEFLATIAKGKLPVNNKTTIANALAFDASKNRCPAACSDTGTDPINWTVYHDSNRLSVCNETMLVDFALYNALDDPETQVRIRACVADATTNTQSSSQSTTTATCISHKKMAQSEATLELGSLAGSGLGSAAQVLDATQTLAKHLNQLPQSCNSSVNFAYSGQSVVAVYAGAEIQSQGIAATVLQQFIEYVQTSPVSGNTFVQLCGTSDRGSDYAMGIIASTNASLDIAQSAVKTWHDGKCLTSVDATTPWTNITILAPTISTQSNITSQATPVARAIRPRATCTTIQVVSGDGCASLASKCGITAALFTTYNPSSTLCSTLAVGQHVCCSAGTLPDYSPQENADGSCASYLVVSGDYCSAIAETNSITIAKIEEYNTETWGWTGCDNLQAGVSICLSTGTPPFPAPITNAVCGPQVPGTVAPTDGSDIALLNQCPLLACCDIWGQCGTTLEFCTPTVSATGAPGTAEAGTNGCISNCGTQIIIGSPPAEYRKIGYFEAFNWDRICLNMDVTDIDTSEASLFTHIHLAFASITDDFQVDVSGIQEQFDMFVSLTGVKRIVSFGGWSFSTDQDTYPIFREGVTAANRATFIASVVSFVTTYNLDGVDFDWEYPGATDIPGIPAGSTEDGLNYFLFLYELKMELGFYAEGASLSIAAPAGYWYLKNFPIEAIAVEVDYIVFMTYDLHGQWDYGSAWSEEGCPAGNCLRSHVNLTETINSLSMITKAGVPSNQVVVGVSSYGRAFEMTTAGCFGETCTYTGPDSTAAPGRCTLTPGYLGNAEIDDIIEQGLASQNFLDESYSNIVVYDDVQWVAYMDDANKAVRTQLYAAYSMGGTSDWAIDLRSFSSASSTGPGVSPTSSSLPIATPTPTPTLITWWVITTELNQGSDGDSLPEITDNFIIVDSPPSCEDAGNAQILTGVDDLSHSGDIGIRCDGCGTGIYPGTATELEIRTSIGHWSKYYILQIALYY